MTTWFNTPLGMVLRVLPRRPDMKGTKLLVLALALMVAAALASCRPTSAMSTGLDNGTVGSTLT